VWILSAKGTYTMDVGADNKFPLYDILMANFRAGYDGNRAPFPIYIHSPWFGSADRQRDMKKFRGELRGIGWLAGGWGGHGEAAPVGHLPPQAAEAALMGECVNCLTL
jgi:hypothetical protein